MQIVRLVTIAASVTFGILLTQPANAQSPLETQAHDHAPVVLAAATADQSEVDATKAVLRDLWIGHVFWVRNVVVAQLAGDAAAQDAAEVQVVANAQAIAASIEPFYGADARAQFFELLAGHYGAVKAYLDASVAGDTGEQSDATAMLLGNATGIADFLSTANPYLPKDAVEGLLQAHGGHHIAQIQQLLGKEYLEEARTWTEMTQHMYVIADATADALAQQFAERF
ncbi:MAG TPA: hypothetical protein PKA33_06800 [Amaricoccus sp.]|uniref:hypothetical protein n=1 Tax=Amaricoccus sp. TaxID=1872485 RepID=UPI002C690FE8|nr:hypothetical protein [Amaricoccus sp.]HMQ91683.1 hypothetical protein [Amaricoccus sp.]HMR52214.1 hypothetical protein [Amaricoccus sp.]HMT99066.1 hypothetical protein [Amaricoccus sp.]